MEVESNYGGLRICKSAVTNICFAVDTQIEAGRKVSESPKLVAELKKYARVDAGIHKLGGCFPLTEPNSVRVRAMREKSGR